MWLPRLDGRRGPRYRAIADALDEDVKTGALRAGARLPPHRRLADQLGVTVTTVTRVRFVREGATVTGLEFNYGEGETPDQAKKIR